MKRENRVKRLQDLEIYFSVYFENTRKKLALFRGLPCYFSPPEPGQRQERAGAPLVNEECP